MRGRHECCESITHPLNQLPIRKQCQQGGRQRRCSHPRPGDLTCDGRDRIRVTTNADEVGECVFKVPEHVPGSRESEGHRVDYIPRGSEGCRNGREASVTSDLSRGTQSIADSRIRQPFGDVV